MPALACRLPGIELLVGALYAALPSFASIGGVLLLTLFCYAVVGVPLFGDIDLSRAQGLSEHANFRNVAQVRTAPVASRGAPASSHEIHTVAAPSCPSRRPSLYSSEH